MSKWRPRAGRAESWRQTRTTPGSGTRQLAIAALVGVAVLAGGFWLFRSIGASRATRLERLEDARGDFDLAYQLRLPGSPLGLAGNGRELIAGDRKGGALRIRRDGRDLEAKAVPIVEPRHKQTINVDALTWNGIEYVGLSTGSWFQREGDVFVVLDGSTLQPTTTKPAPELLGCMAWDGRFYWAATRKHTAGQDVPALLYKLDRNFKVVATSDAPGSGCQGMVSDGRYLWLADVFSDAITIVDTAKSPPRVVRRVETPIAYLSGIARFEDEIWVTEYGTNRLYRLRPEVRTAWLGGEAAPAQIAAMVQPAQRREETPAPRAVTYDRAVNSLATRPADDAELLDWSVDLGANAVHGSWRVWFGPEVFTRREQAGIVTIPQFARYTVTVTKPGGEKVEKVFEATPGENVMNGVHLCDATTPGEYSVSLFIHVQFVGADGEAKILNRSRMPLRVTFR